MEGYQRLISAPTSHRGIYQDQSRVLSASFDLTRELCAVSSLVSKNAQQSERIWPRLQSPDLLPLCFLQPAGSRGPDIPTSWTFPGPSLDFFVLPVSYVSD